MMNPGPRSDINIRIAVDSDKTFILANVSRLLDFGPPSWRDSASMLATDSAVLEHALTAGPPESIIFIAERGGMPIGFIHLTGEFDYYSQKEQSHIADLVVAKGGRRPRRWRGADTSRRVVGREERGSELLTLNVFLQNTRARRLYKRVGFEADTLRYIKRL